MANITIRETWYNDPRRQALQEWVGWEVDTVALNLWRFAERYIREGVLHLPVEVFELVYRWKELEACRLVRREPEGIYVCGSRDRWNWLQNRRERARLGGLAKARKMRSSSTKLARARQMLSKCQNPPSPPLDSPPIPPSSSPSLHSLSSSLTLTPPIIPPITPKELSSTSSPTTPIRTFYFSEWSKLYPGAKPLWGAKEGNLLKQDLRFVDGDSEKLMRGLRRYLDDASPFFCTHAHPYTLFSAQKNSWLIEPRLRAVGGPIFPSGPMED